MHNRIDHHEYMLSQELYWLFHSVDSLEVGGLENSFRTYLLCMWEWGNCFHWANRKQTSLFCSGLDFIFMVSSGNCISWSSSQVFLWPSRDSPQCPISLFRSSSFSSWEGTVYLAAGQSSQEEREEKQSKKNLNENKPNHLVIWGQWGKWQRERSLKLPVHWIDEVSETRFGPLSLWKRHEGEQYQDCGLPARGLLLADAVCSGEEQKLSVSVFGSTQT